MIILFFLAVFLFCGLIAFGEIYYERDWPRHTGRFAIIAGILFLFSLSAFGQNTRWDLPITTVQAQGGNLLPVYAIPGAGIKFYSCSGSVCTTLATTYISATSGTTCPVSPTPMQVTLNGSSTCVSTADPYGNMGAWFQAGQYMATITAQGGSYNYYFTVGSGGGTGCFPNTIPNGCTGATTAAGANGTLGIPGPVFNVVGYGAVGDGVLSTAMGTDNYDAIQATINQALGVKGAEVFLPCGVYEISQPLTVYGFGSPHIDGPAANCVQIQYNGTTSTQGVLTVSATAPTGVCNSTSCSYPTSGLTCCAERFEMNHITLIGNANVPDALDLLNTGYTDVENSILIGASNSSVYCADCGNFIFRNDNGTSNAIALQTGYTAHESLNGLILDAYNAPSNIGIVESWTQNGLPSGGKALWLRSSTGAELAACQLSGNPISIQIDNTSAGNEIDRTCLAENGGNGGVVNIAAGVVNTTIENASFSGALNIAGQGTQVIGGSTTQINIAATARGTVIDHNNLVGTLSNLSDLSPDTEYRCLITAGTSRCLTNMPIWRWSPSFGASNPSGVLIGIGSWGFGTSESNIDVESTVSFTGQWSIEFNGTWEGTGGYLAEPAKIELSSGTPSITLSSSQVLTISISGASPPYLQAEVSSGSVQFVGSITFIPAASSTVSEIFANAVDAPGYQVNGTPLSTSNLSDWTNTGAETNYIATCTTVVDSVCTAWAPAANSGGALVGTTGTITGTALTASCDSGTASVSGAVVGSPVAVSSTTGADIGGAFNLRASVTSTDTVTVYVCGTGTPASLAYNVTVF